MSPSGLTCLTGTISWNHGTMNHRMTERFELNGVFKGHLVPIPCHMQGLLPLDRGAQSLSRLAMKTSRHGAFITSLDLFQCLRPLILKGFYIQSKSSFSLKLLLLVLSAQDPVKSSPAYPKTFRYWKGTLRSAQSFLLSRLNSPSSRCLFS